MISILPQILFWLAVWLLGSIALSIVVSWLLRGASEAQHDDNPGFAEITREVDRPPEGLAQIDRSEPHGRG